MATIYTDPFMTLRIKKRLASQPTVDWENEYHFLFPSNGPTGDARRDKLEDIANAVFRFERAFHLNLVQFTSGIWSTQTPEPPQTTPENHLTIPFPTNNLGTRVTTPSQIPANLNQVLWVSKEVSAGSLGRLFYRGVLDGAMLEGVIGMEKTTLDLDSPVTQELIDDFADIRETEIRPYLYPILPSADEVSMVMFYTPAVGPTITRSIYNLYINGATDNRRNKKFFNVNPVTP